MCPDQLWVNQINFGIIVGPAGPLLVVKIGPAGPIFSPDQVFRDRPAWPLPPWQNAAWRGAGEENVPAGDEGAGEDN